MYSVLLVALCNSQAQVLFNPNLVSKENKVDLIRWWSVSAKTCHGWKTISTIPRYSKHQVVSRKVLWHSVNLNWGSTIFNNTNLDLTMPSSCLHSLRLMILFSQFYVRYVKVPEKLHSRGPTIEAVTYSDTHVAGMVPLIAEECIIRNGEWWNDQHKE